MYYWVKLGIAYSKIVMTIHKLIMPVHCIRFHLAGPKKGQWEEFVDNLPGLPDNIRPSNDGGYWIAMGFCRYQGKFDMLGYFSEKLMLRKYISKVQSLI